MLDLAQSWVLANPLSTVSALSIAAIVIGYATLQHSRRPGSGPELPDHAVAEGIHTTHPRC